jgi:hypothetical protein
MPTYFSVNVPVFRSLGVSSIRRGFSAGFSPSSCFSRFSGRGVNGRGLSGSLAIMNPLLTLCDNGVKYIRHMFFAKLRLHDGTTVLIHKGHIAWIVKEQQ